MRISDWSSDVCSSDLTKDLCGKAGIPTAGYVRAKSEAEATAALVDFALPVVIKADGLAAGKGVVLAMSEAEAQDAIAHMFSGGFGEAGAEGVIEEFLTGEEGRFFVLGSEARRGGLNGVSR